MLLSVECPELALLYTCHRVHKTAIDTVRRPLLLNLPYSTPTIKAYAHPVPPCCRWWRRRAA